MNDMQGNGVVRIKYEVVAYSSEDPLYPATNIQTDYQNNLVTSF